jgi:hypothetical protein
MTSFEQYVAYASTVFLALYVILSTTAHASFLPQSVRDIARFLALDIASLAGRAGKPIDTGDLTPDAVRKIVLEAIDEKFPLKVIKALDAPPGESPPTFLHVLNLPRVTVDTIEPGAKGLFKPEPVIDSRPALTSTPITEDDHVTDK